MSQAHKLLMEALQLDERQRASLALDLMDSVSPPDRRDEGSWLIEIERRAHRALSGEEPGVDFEDAVAALSHDLGL